MNTFSYLSVSQLVLKGSCFFLKSWAELRLPDFQGNISPSFWDSLNRGRAWKNECNPKKNAQNGEQMN